MSNPFETVISGRVRFLTFSPQVTSCASLVIEDANGERLASIVLSNEEARELADGLHDFLVTREEISVEVKA